MDILERLDQLTATDPKQRATLFRFMANLSDHERGKVIAAALGKSHKYDRTHPDRERYGYVFTIEVELIKELNGRKKIVKKGLRALGTPERIQVLQDRRLGALEKIATERKKKATKRAILEKERPAIIEARKKGYSWETIAQYIGKQHGIKVSRETVRKIVDTYDRAQASSSEKS
ncbi:MAG: hypothetical protein PHI99_02400 [Syntrophales bacterium]|nr:hypothetical protein [Syntrophales bacterium]